MKSIVCLVLITSISLVSACGKRNTTQASVLINPQQPQTCQQLETQIKTLEETPKTEVFTPEGSPVPFTFKNKYTDQLKALKRQAAIKGCYDRPAYIPQKVTVPPAIKKTPAPIKTQTTTLNFDQCFTKCKQYTSRSNEQCFDSCK